VKRFLLVRGTFTKLVVLMRVARIRFRTKRATIFDRTEIREVTPKNITIPRPAPLRNTFVDSLPERKRDVIAPLSLAGPFRLPDSFGMG